MNTERETYIYTFWITAVNIVETNLDTPVVGYMYTFLFEFYVILNTKS